MKVVRPDCGCPVSGSPSSARWGRLRPRLRERDTTQVVSPCSCSSPNMGHPQALLDALSGRETPKEGACPSTALHEVVQRVVFIAEVRYLASRRPARAHQRVKHPTARGRNAARSPPSPSKPGRLNKLLRMLLNPGHKTRRSATLSRNLTQRLTTWLFVERPSVTSSRLTTRAVWVIRRCRANSPISSTNT